MSKRIKQLFASMAVNTRLAELLLPMLSLPFFLPIVIAAILRRTKFIKQFKAVRRGVYREQQSGHEHESAGTKF